MYQVNLTERAFPHLLHLDPQRILHNVMLSWLYANKAWVFSGVGVAVITIVGGFVWGRIPRGRGAVRQEQVAGDNSTLVQGRGDVNISVTQNIEKKP